MGALRQGVNQDALTRNTSGRNVDDGFRGKKRVRGKADSFLPLLPSKYTDHPRGHHDVLRSSPDMPWQEQTLPMKCPLAPADAAGAVVLFWPQALLCVQQTFKENAVFLLADPSR